jgi:tRNA threonylcarbamoyladenosine biosynthesis protein TsaB
LIILAIDTAQNACSAGVWRDGAMLADESVHMPQGHAEALMPMIERVMATAGLNYAALNRIAVTVGPGSFTGVRVGIATARGLAMAAQKPAVGIPTTESLAAAAVGHSTGENILSVIDSKRGDVFAQVFSPEGAAMTDVLNVGFSVLKEYCRGPCVVVGDAAETAARHLGPEAKAKSGTDFCQIADVARLAVTRRIDPAGPIPLYVRAPDVTISASGGALRP